MTAEVELTELTDRVHGLTADERDLADKAATWAEHLRNAETKLAAADQDVEDKTRASATAPSWPTACARR